MQYNNSSHSEQNKTLSEWLYYLENLHNTEIDLGLTRIKQVADRLGYDFACAFDFAQVIIVAGTNGKGTTCAFLENALLLENSSEEQATVAVYSSPHIEQFNERLRVDKKDVADQPLIHAFEQIEQARGEISLSYYEYTTLAAFLVLLAVKPKYIILEVGLGGRLDATNIVDADIAVITTIDIDHQAFLGNTRELIGFEKAGVMRNKQNVVIGDTNIPESVLAHGTDIKANMMVRSQQFTITEQSDSNQWQYNFQNSNQPSTSQHIATATVVIPNLITPYIPRDNVATALTVLITLGIQLCSNKVNHIIENTKVAGRVERFKASEKPDVLRCDVILDVAHNPQAAQHLAQRIQSIKYTQKSKNEKSKYSRIHAVVGMLSDKDISNALLPMLTLVDCWYLGQLNVPRGATSDVLAEKLTAQLTQPLTAAADTSVEQVGNANSINCFDNVTQAFKIANQNAVANDLILVFGSFFTVAEIRRLLV